MIEEALYCLVRIAFDLTRPLLAAEHRWNRNTCDAVHNLDIALLELEHAHGRRG